MGRAFVLLVASDRTSLAILRLVSEDATSVQSYVLLFVNLSLVHFYPQQIKSKSSLTELRLSPLSIY